MLKQIHILYLVFFLLLIMGACNSSQVQLSQNEVDFTHVEKQKGVHVFGRIDSLSLVELSNNHMEWITLVPFGGQEDIDSPDINFRRGRSEEEVERRNQRWINQMKMIKEAGFKVFLKPHIWIYRPSDGKWRSDLYTENEAWNEWKESYRNFILHYAEMAEICEVEMFCVGTELTRLSLEKPQFWEELIKDVRAIYKGKLTYAANWYEEYESIGFWDQLDFIGIQAYFPLTKNKNPDLTELKKSWQKKLPDLAQLSQKRDRPILFTEIGYKSTEDAAISPWEWIDYSGDVTVNESTLTQANAYQAVFETVWQEPWFAGMHLWQWRSDHRDRRGKNHLDFTPQGKPAQEVIAKAYGEL